MLHKTEGVVLNVSTYNDVYSITQVFTRDFGRVTYLLPKKGGRKSKIKTSLFFPLSILTLEVEHLPLRDIQRLKEVERAIPLYNTCTNVTKTSIVFFLSEFLSKILRETHDNELIYAYLRNSIETLEEVDKGLANFHIAFMFGLTRYLGIYPNLESYRKNGLFDLMNSEFVHTRPIHNHYLSVEQSYYLKLLSRINFSNMHLYKLSRSDRNMIVENLLTYYRLHVYNFSAMKSLDVLKELF